MVKYFWHNGLEQKGPFTLEELKTQPLEKNTPVWFEGKSEWTTAEQVPCLSQELFSQVSHRNRNCQKTRNNLEKHQFRMAKRWGIIGILCLTLSVIAATIMYIDQSYPVQYSITTQPDKMVKDSGSPLQKQVTTEKEKLNPSNFIKNYASIRSNVMGKKVIHGNLTNTASFAVFKDVTLRINFLSNSNKDLGSKEFTFYEILNPGQTIPFRCKTFAPDSTSQFAINVIKATPAN